MWKVRKVVSDGDYNYVIVERCPNATKNGDAIDHRIVIENHLKRLLGPSEFVNHTNGNKHGKTASVEQAISGNLVREFYSHDNPEETD